MSRLSIDPLLLAIHPNEEYARKRLKITPKQLKHYREKGITIHTAERLADMVHVHVLGVWPNPYGTEEEIQAVDDGLMSSHEVAALLNVNYQRIHRLVSRCGFRPTVNPSGTGTKRRFSKEDAEKLDVIFRAIKLGLRPNYIVALVQANWDSRAPEMRFVNDDFLEVVIPVRAFDEIA